MTNLSDIVNIVHGDEANGLAKEQVSKVAKAVIDTISRTLSDGGEVNINGFGKFSVNERSARVGRNPMTGETVQVAASKNVKFKASKSLKDVL